MLLSIVLLVAIIQPSYQTIYSCNTTATCGCSNKSISINRIVGGESADVAAWTWAVSISIDDRYLCGGSIISSSWILTAAHCVNGYSASQVRIYAGSIYVRGGNQSRVASRIIMHPYYRSATYENDIALLRLSSPLPINDPSIDVICIPSVDSATLSAGEWPAVGTNVVAVGWGTLSEGGSLPTNLQQVTVQTVAYNAPTCVRDMVDRYIQLCAGVSGGGKDTCQGDSGGPLMMFAPNKQWILIGITSFGDGCARSNASGVYTRVAAFQDWISINTNNAVSTSPTPIAATSTTVRMTPSTTMRVTPSTTTSRAASHGNAAKTLIFIVYLLFAKFFLSCFK